MIATPKAETARPSSNIPPPTTPVAPAPAGHEFISSSKAQTLPSKRTWTGRIPLWIIVGLVMALSPFVKRGFDQALNRPPDLTPEACIQSIFKVDGINTYLTQRRRVLDRIASMNCAELSSMILYARQNQEKFKNLTPQEIQNVNEVGEAFKLRVSVAGCQVTADGSYVEPTIGSAGR